MLFAFNCGCFTNCVASPFNFVSLMSVMAEAVGLFLGSL